MIFVEFAAGHFPPSNTLEASNEKEGKQKLKNRNNSQKSGLTGREIIEYFLAVIYIGMLLITCFSSFWDQMCNRFSCYLFPSKNLWAQASGLFEDIAQMRFFAFSLGRAVCFFLGLCCLISYWLCFVWEKDTACSRAVAKGARYLSYSVWVFSFGLAIYYPFSHNNSIWLLVFILTLVFYSFSQISFRTSFRLWPNIFLSIAGTLLYLSIILLVNGNGIFGYFFENLKLQLERFKSEAIWVGVSTLLSTFLAVLVDAAKNTISHGLNDTAKRRRRTIKALRCDLISPRLMYKVDIHSRSLLIACLFCGTGAVLIWGIATDKFNLISFLMVALSAIFTLLGISTHTFCSDHALLRAERAYIAHRTLIIKEADIRNSHETWLRYCQVVANSLSYCSYDLAEDAHSDRSFDFLDKLYYDFRRHKNSGSIFCEHKLVFDIIHAYQQTQDILLEMRKLEGKATAEEGSGGENAGSAKAPSGERKITVSAEAPSGERKITASVKEQQALQLRQKLAQWFIEKLPPRENLKDSVPQWPLDYWGQLWGLFSSTAKSPSQIVPRDRFNFEQKKKLAFLEFCMKASFKDNSRAHKAGSCVNCHMYWCCEKCSEEPDVGTDKRFTKAALLLSLPLQMVEAQLDENLKETQIQEEAYYRQLYSTLWVYSSQSQNAQLACPVTQSVVDLLKLLLDEKWCRIFSEAIRENSPPSFFFKRYRPYTDLVQALRLYNYGCSAQMLLEKLRLDLTPKEKDTALVKSGLLVVSQCLAKTT